MSSTPDAMETYLQSRRTAHELPPVHELGPCIFVEGQGPAVDEMRESFARRLDCFLHVYAPPRQDDQSGNAGRYFTPIAHAIINRRPLVLGNSWLVNDPVRSVGVGRWRMLERAALALGAVEIGSLCWKSSIPGLGHITELATEVNEARYPNPGPGAGAWRPGRSILMVGDRPNSAKHGDLKHRLPFFSKHAGGCSLWLAEQLHAAAVPESEIYWINAYDMDGVATHGGFLDALRPRKIIALGTQAAQWCRLEACLPLEDFTLVPHPQHWKRFRASDRYPLLDALDGLGTP